MAIIFHYRSGSPFAWRVWLALFDGASIAAVFFPKTLARAYGPLGVHVALLVIDAVVGEPWRRSKLADRPDDFFCAPHDIADTAVMLTRQKRYARTFELEVRPFAQKWRAVAAAV
jgi:hypothetical protein